MQFCCQKSGAMVAWGIGARLLTVRNTVADRKIWPEPWLTDHLPEEAANESEVKIKLQS